jgi:hypothetical protein
LHLRNNEHFEFIVFVLALIDETGAAELKIAKRYAALAALHRQEDEALAKVTKSALTEGITDLDRQRDEMYQGMANAIRAAQTHFDPAVRAAAKRLVILIDTYGNPTRKSQVEETSIIYNLLKDMAAAKYINDVEKIGVTGFIPPLDSLNNAVEDLITGRADEIAEQTALILKEVRTQVDEAYEALATLLGSLAVVAAETESEDAPMYQNFIRRLNERIDILNNSLAIRRGQAEARHEAEEEKKKQEAAAAAEGSANQ